MPVAEAVVVGGGTLLDVEVVLAGAVFATVAGDALDDVTPFGIDVDVDEGGVVCGAVIVGVDNLGELAAISTVTGATGAAIIFVKFKTLRLVLETSSPLTYSTR